MNESTLHGGHRARMREKLRVYGPQVFETHELLEMLLYHAVLHRDTNPSAHRLLETFGSLDGVLEAEENELMQVEGIGERVASFLLTVGRLGTEAVFEQSALRMPTFTTYEAVGSFLSAFLEKENGSPAALLLLDNRMSYIACRPIGKPGQNPMTLRPVDFLSVALTYSAAVAFLAFSHPHGPLCAFPEEHYAAAEYARLFTDVQVALPEVFVVSGKRYVGVLGSCQPGARPETADEAEDENAPTARITERTESFLRRFLAPILSGSESDAAASALTRRFCSVATLLSADNAQIAEVPEAGPTVATYFRLVLAVTARRFADRFRMNVMPSAADVMQYLIAQYVNEPAEAVTLLMFDENVRTVACERICVGTVNSATFDTRRMLEIALRYHARLVIFAHTHPGGDAEPSRADRETTALLFRAFESVGIRPLAHYVVAGGRIACVTPPSLLPETVFPVCYRQEDGETVAEPDESETLPCRFEEVARDVYLLRMPLSVIWTGAVLLRGKKENILIDTGADAPERYLLPALRELGVSPESVTWLLATHAHGDHIGAHAAFVSRFGAKVAALAGTEEPLLHPEKTAARLLSAYPKNSPRRLPALQGVAADRLLAENETLAGRVFPIAAPGQAEDGVCWYDVPTKTLICGDALQGNGTDAQGIAFYQDLSAYRETLKKLGGYEIETLVCAHDFDGIGSVICGKERVSEVLAACESYAEQYDRKLRDLYAETHDTVTLSQRLIGAVGCGMPAYLFPALYTVAAHLKAWKNKPKP